MFHLQSKSDAQLQRDVEKQVGPDLMRFGPVTHEAFSSFRTLSSKMNVSSQDRSSLALIQSRLGKMPRKEAIRKKLTKVQILRIAHFCNFDVDRSLKLIDKVKSRYFELSAATLKEQLASQTIFPCPGLETRDGSKVFVMRPSRYVPNQTPVSDIIDHLIFVMDRMTQQDLITEQKGVAFVANMDSWKLRNLSAEYCRKFMMALQGQLFPAKVNLFLIVNPPSWFGKIWTLMQPMLSLSFRRRVHILDYHDLHSFLKDDFLQHLPDDIPGGTVHTEKLVRDYVAFHLALEESTHSRGVAAMIPLPIGRRRKGDDVLEV